MDSPFQLIFQQPNHGHFLPVDRLLPDVETEYSLSLSRGLEPYFFQKYSGKIKIAKSRPEGDRLAILFLISRSSPIAKVAIGLLRHRIVLRLGFPPHIIHLFQPLALVLFGVIRTLLNTLEQSDEMNKQTIFATKLLYAFEKAPTSANIRSAFECAAFVSTMENDESTGHLGIKNFMKSHSSTHFLMPASLGIRF